jgi:adenosylhomocysteine nucleosidase
MTISKIGLIAAMPQEIRPFLKIAGKCQKGILKGFPLYSFTIYGTECRLIESGIGTMRAEAALGALIAATMPDLLISFGFCGAAKPGFAVGDIAIARSSIPFKGNAADLTKQIAIRFPPEVLQSQVAIGQKNRFSVKPCEFITSAEILNKKEFRAALPREITNPVLDMETWGLARMASEHGIRFLAIRSVSDAAEEELQFGLDQFLDEGMKIRISRVLAAILARPGILPQLMRLGVNSKIAGANLAVLLKGVISAFQARNWEWE